MKTRAYNGELIGIEKLHITKTITPVIYLGNIGGRDGSILGHENEREKYEWQTHQEKYNNIKRLLADYFSEHDLNKTSFAALTFPHVTTIFSFTSIGNAQSNFESSLFNTDDLSPNPGIVRGKNKVTQCGLEVDVLSIEKNIWYPAYSLEDYYAEDRIPILKAYYNLFGKTHLKVLDKLK